MPQSQITTWLDFALQQLAAESYLQGISLSDNDSVIERLKLGNNNPLFNDPNNPNLGGRTRFVDLDGVLNANQIVGSAQGKRTGTFYISERPEAVCMSTE